MSKRKIEIDDGSGGSGEQQQSSPNDQPAEAEQSAHEESGEPQQPEPAQPAAEQRVAELETELAQLNDRLLRVSADYQNYVRRSQQNVNDARDQQLMEVARSLVTVLDHFDRALEVDTNTATADSVLEGLKIVRNELLAALDRFGIQRLDVSAGDEFDPNRHEALMRQAVEDIKPNHVVAQLQPGYTLGDKTLRAAQVSVAE